MGIFADGGASLEQQSATRASCEHHRFNSIPGESAGFGAPGLRAGGRRRATPAFSKFWLLPDHSMGVDRRCSGVGTTVGFARVGE